MMVNGPVLMFLLGFLHVHFKVSANTAINFILYVDKRSWNDAEAICVRNGGQLVNIQDEVTFKALTYFTKTTEWQNSISDYFWTGLHTEGSSFKWSDCQNLTNPTYWEEPDIADRLDTGCVRGNSKTLQWLPSTCSDKLQYLCQRELGPCVYDSMDSGFDKCSPSLVTGTTITTNNELECRGSCDTSVNEFGNQCWAYYFYESTNICSLLHDADPYFCDTADTVSVLSIVQELLSDKINIRRCFDLDVNETTERSELNASSILLDCSKTAGQQSTIIDREEERTMEDGGRHDETVTSEEQGTVQLISSSYSSFNVDPTEPVPTTTLPCSSLAVHDQEKFQSGCSEGNIASSSLTESRDELTISPFSAINSPSSDIESESSVVITSQKTVDENEENIEVKIRDNVSIMPSTSISSLAGFSSSSSSRSDSLRSHRSTNDLFTNPVLVQGTTEFLPGTITSSPKTTKSLIACTCARCLLRSNDSSLEDLRLLMKDLKVDKRSLSSARRKLTTAADNRKSAQTIGCVGVVFIAITVCCMVLSDLTSFLSRSSSRVKMKRTNV